MYYLHFQLPESWDYLAVLHVVYGFWNSFDLMCQSVTYMYLHHILQNLKKWVGINCSYKSKEETDLLSYETKFYILYMKSSGGLVGRWFVTLKSIRVTIGLCEGKPFNNFVQVYRVLDYRQGEYWNIIGCRDLFFIDPCSAQ